MTRAEFEHVEACAKRFVARARGGDDEALEALWMETRVSLFSLVPAGYRPTVPPDRLLEVLHLAVLEAELLWQPARAEDYCDAVNRRLKRRLRDYFLQQQSILTAVEEVASVE